MGNDAHLAQRVIRLEAEKKKLLHRVFRLELALLVYRQHNMPDLTDDEWIEQTLAMFANRAGEMRPSD